MGDNPRIAELRRRVEADPASIAFAQLAEEYRRGGDYERAVAVCRTGLAQYPGYVSARLTLGRALIELGRFEDARAELDRVLKITPDNLAAVRSLEDLRERVRLARPGPSVGTPTARSPDPALRTLETWLEAILADRARRLSTNAAS